ncbi:CocE/NonD family hydrolase [Allorhizocola rhizosphaerae]|uniref:CocE/NonD family hydrolase n=1 Tax=Allorhizocola rhizosphaerae TaxID=1872709 RepID=UPI001B8CA178|nr:CocE/NonD family hydrolase [Allorhizocola rhizosphaerae]
MALAPALVTILMVAALLPAADTAPDHTVTTVHVKTVVGPHDSAVCDVVADLYLPHTATPDNPAPAILTTHGFGGAKDDASQRATGRAFAAQGYVVLSYSGLGFGGSGCKITLDDPAWDGKAARQLVDYLAGTGKVRLDGPGDPRVGMIGGSYGGQAQFAAAGIDPRIDALIPLITWHDLAYSLAPNNSGDAPGVHKKVWTSLFFAEGINDGVTGAQYDPARLVGCPNFTDEVCVGKAQLEVLGYPTPGTTALTRRVSVASYIERISAPTLLVQGQADTLFNLNEAARTYAALAERSVPVKMIWQSWGHSQGTPAPGELDLSPEGLHTSYLGRRFLAWFDHYLKGLPTDTGPRFAYHRDWSNSYAGSESYPVGRPQSLHLSGDASLVESAHAVRAGSQAYANAAGGVPTSYSETSALQGNRVPDPLAVPFDAPGTFAAWTSRPLASELVTVGVPTLDIRLESPAAALTQRLGPAGQLVLFAKLYDVAPDGTISLRHRLISPVRVADVTEPLRIELPGIAQRWPAGHRIRLVLAASDAAYAGNATVLPVTVRLGPDRPGVLHLPVVGGPARFR